MEIANRPIGITGASGFIGKHLTNLFNTVKIPYVEFTGDITLAKDVQEYFRMHRPGHIIHLAGKHLGTPEELLSVNCGGVINLLAASKEYSCEHILFSSSAAVYGNVHQLSGARESDTLAPNTLYGKSKVAAEHHILSAIKSGVKGTILRLGSVYGPNQTAGIIPALQHSIDTDRVVYYDQERPVVRQFIHVFDVCQVVHELLTDTFTGVVNVSSSEVYSLKDLADIMTSKYIFGRKHRPANTEYTDMRMDISTLQTVLGYQPTLSLREYLLQ